MSIGERLMEHLSKIDRTTPTAEVVGMLEGVGHEMFATWWSESLEIVGSKCVFVNQAVDMDVVGADFVNDAREAGVDVSVSMFWHEPEKPGIEGVLLPYTNKTGEWSEDHPPAPDYLVYVASSISETSVAATSIARMYHRFEALRDSGKGRTPPNLLLFVPLASPASIKRFEAQFADRDMPVPDIIVSVPVNDCLEVVEKEISSAVKAWAVETNCGYAPFAPPSFPMRKREERSGVSSETTAETSGPRMSL